MGQPLGMDRKRLSALPRLHKSSRRHRRIQWKIYGEPKSASRRLCSNPNKTYSPHLPKLFSNQFALAIYGIEIGKIITDFMNTKTQPQRNTTFKNEIIEGLTAFPKYLSSKYFYDKRGDKLFQDIMAMPSYYLTDCEFDIISNNTFTIGELFRDRENGLDLIELGAGDGKKTKVLLRYMAENNFNFVYKPIDISENAVEMLSTNLASEMPLLKVDAE